MSDLYVVHRDEPGEVSPAGGIQATMTRVRKRTANFEGPFSIFERGSTNKSYRRERKNALEVYRKKLLALDVGDVLVLMERRTSRRRVETRMVSEAVVLPDQADLWPKEQKAVYEHVMGSYDGVRWGGTCNCRETRQGGSLSDHACCHAGDFFPKSKAQGDDIHRDLMDDTQKYNIRYISWQVALHFDHLHVATGPPCSGCF